MVPKNQAWNTYKLNQNFAGFYASFAIAPYLLCNNFHDTMYRKEVQSDTKRLLVKSNVLFSR